MIIKDAQFVISNTKLSKCPDPDKPEYAFVGRSNVGKSSLINMLMNVKNLAKTSQSPGKTQLINHFIVNEEWYLVDLPGYGYAKVSKSIRSTFSKMIQNYAINRENLICLFVLIDSRHKPQEQDLEFLRFLGMNQVPFAIIFTKSDKLSQSELSKSISNYKKSLLEEWESLPEIFISSSVKRNGRDEILSYIEKLNKIS